MIEDKQRWFEIIAMLVTGILKFVFVDWLNFKFLFVIIACLFWVGYIIIRTVQNKKVLAYWGFSSKYFMQCFRLTFLILALPAMAFIVFGIFKGYEVNFLNLFLILLLYPIWGIIQQFLMMGLLAGNLTDMRNVKIPKAFIILITSTVFSVVHYPSTMLIAGTFMLALLYTFIFLKWRNIYPLGLFHGWLGGLFYFFVLNRDPWVEFISMLNS